MGSRGTGAAAVVCCRGSPAATGGSTPAAPAVGVGRNRRLDTGGRCRGRGAKRLLAQQPGQRERDERNAGGGQEHRLQGGGDRMHVGRVHRGRQVLHDLRVGGGGGGGARRQLGGELAGQPVGEDRAEGGHADRTADLPEQRRTRGGN